jgi:cytochrome oxidase Cu insertion factor (SCO1/SenC/PrrC family)
MATRDKGRARRTLIVLALLCAAPVVASYVAYYWLKPAAHVNYGELLDPVPIPEITGISFDGGGFRLSAYRGRWVMLAADAGPCEETCRRKLYATRQARTIQGREQERVVRVWITNAMSLREEALAQHPGLVAAHVDSAQWPALPGPGGATGNIYLIDPLGNLVLRYSADPDIKRMANDLERLLRASRIG